MSTHTHTHTYTENFVYFLAVEEGDWPSLLLTGGSVICSASASTASSNGIMTLKSDSINDKGSMGVPLRSKAVWTANACKIAPSIALG